MEQRHFPRPDRVAAVLLCLVFLFFSMGFVLMGGNVYQKDAAQADENADTRTVLAYLANQVRRADAAGAVAAGQFSGNDALFFYQTYSGDTYVTCIYCYDGFLRELFYQEGATGLGPDAGEAILALSALTVEDRDGVLALSATNIQGDTALLQLTPRCGLGEVRE